MNKLEKARKMFRINLIKELKEAKMKDLKILPSMEMLLKAMEKRFQDSKDQEILRQMARVLAIRNSPQEVVEVLKQRLNLSPQDQRALKLLVQDKIK